MKGLSSQSLVGSRKRNICYLNTPNGHCVEKNNFGSHCQFKIILELKYLSYQFNSDVLYFNIVCTYQEI